MDGCYYVSPLGYAFGWTQLFPTLVTFFCSVVGLIFHQLLFFFLGLYFQAVQYSLWPLQVYFNSVRPNPVCAVYHSFAFPNVETFYVVAIITFVIAYGYGWGVEMSWVAWLVLYVLGGGTLLILWYTQYVRWWELLVTSLMAIVATAAFVTALALYITPTLPWLLNAFPCNWLGYKDNFFLDVNVDAPLVFAIEQCLAQSNDAVQSFRKRGLPSAGSWLHY